MRSAALVESASAMLASLISLSLILLLAFYFVPGPREIPSALVGILLGAAHIAAIRGGTLAVYGAVANAQV